MAVFRWWKLIALYTHAQVLLGLLHFIKIYWKPRAFILEVGSEVKCWAFFFHFTHSKEICLGARHLLESPWVMLPFAFLERHLLPFQCCLLVANCRTRQLGKFWQADSPPRKLELPHIWGACILKTQKLVKVLVKVWCKLLSQISLDIPKTCQKGFILLSYNRILF